MYLDLDVSISLSAQSSWLCEATLDLLVRISGVASVGARTAPHHALDAS